jgi:hypothetical protein
MRKINHDEHILNLFNKLDRVCEKHMGDKVHSHVRLEELSTIEHQTFQTCMEPVRAKLKFDMFFKNS